MSVVVDLTGKTYGCFHTCAVSKQMIRSESVCIFLLVLCSHRIVVKWAEAHTLTGLSSRPSNRTEPRPKLLGLIAPKCGSCVHISPNELSQRQKRHLVSEHPQTIPFLLLLPLFYQENLKSLLQGSPAQDWRQYKTAYNQTYVTQDLLKWS